MNFFVPVLTDAGSPIWWYELPQPVLIIATYDENGKANAMNACDYVGIVSANKELDKMEML